MDLAHAVIMPSSASSSSASSTLGNNWQPPQSQSQSQQPTAAAAATTGLLPTSNNSRRSTTNAAMPLLRRAVEELLRVCELEADGLTTDAAAAKVNGITLWVHETASSSSSSHWGGAPFPHHFSSSSSSSGATSTKIGGGEINNNDEDLLAEEGTGPQQMIELTTCTSSPLQQPQPQALPPFTSNTLSVVTPSTSTQQLPSLPTVRSGCGGGNKKTSGPRSPVMMTVSPHLSAFSSSPPPHPQQQLQQEGGMGMGMGMGLTEINLAPMPKRAISPYAVPTLNSTCNTSSSSLLSCSSSCCGGGGGGNGGNGLGSGTIGNGTIGNGSILSLMNTPNTSTMSLLRCGMDRDRRSPVAGISGRSSPSPTAFAPLPPPPLPLFDTLPLAHSSIL